MVYSFTGEWEYPGPTLIFYFNHIKFFRFFSSASSTLSECEARVLGSKVGLMNVFIFIFSSALNTSRSTSSRKVRR